MALPQQPLSLDDTDPGLRPTYSFPSTSSTLKIAKVFHCSNCKKQTTWRPCAPCRCSTTCLAFYCSVDCQIADWPNHDAHCIPWAQRKQKEAQGSKVHKPKLAIVPMIDIDTSSESKKLCELLLACVKDEGIFSPEELLQPIVFCVVNQEFLEPLSKLQEGYYGKHQLATLEDNGKQQDKCVFYRLKHLLPSPCTVNPGTAADESLKSSRAASSITKEETRGDPAAGGVQVTRIAHQYDPQSIAEAIELAQEKMLNEIEKRRQDIESIDNQVSKLLNQIADHGCVGNFEVNEITCLAQMKGQHAREIQKLEALKETKIQLKVETSLICVEIRRDGTIRREETTEVKIETFAVPANKPATISPYSAIHYFRLDGQLLAAGGDKWIKFDKEIRRMEPDEKRAPFFTMDRFQEASRKWKLLPTRCKAGRQIFAVAMLDKLLYVLSGWDKKQFSQTKLKFTSLERYDPLKARWEYMAPMLSARIPGSMAVAVMKKQLYIIGGCMTGGNSVREATYLKTVERYDPTRNRWEPVPALKTARAFCAAAVMNGKLYVMGGHNHKDTLSSVECFDMKRNEWYSVAPMNNARFGHASAVLADQLFVTGKQSTEYYDAVLDVWTEVRS